MIVVGRHVNGITLNELEYLLEENGDLKVFNNEEEAIAFLKLNNVTDEEIEYLVFETFNEEEFYGT